jgi:transcription-repair coupling factor (superfamily II helicase)
MRDLEIRGAGNLLGEAQAGHIAAVGYDLYCQLVTEAVAELKGEEIKEPAEIKLDLPVNAHIPRDYIEREDLRLEAYRRLAAVTGDAEVDDIRREWEDRYGPVPPPAASLLDVARLRGECVRLGIREVNVARGPGFGGPEYIARLTPVAMKASETIRLHRLVKEAVYKEGPAQLQLPVRRRDELTTGLVTLLRAIFPPSSPEP